jgi:ATP-dependent RNA helicase DeaD
MSDTPNESGSGFADLGLRPELLTVLATLGYEEPTPIQRETIPLLIQGHDLLGQAATGTGKTAAFALPILQRIDRNAAATPLALVLVPTRELAVQVSEAMYKYGRDLGAKVLPIYGGQPIGRQLQQLDRGVHVVVATPGRAIDHINRGTLPLDRVQMVVLDEADEMLDMGFAEDIEAILKATPSTRQTVMFSATMPPRINSIAKRHQREPLRVQIGIASSDRGQSPLVKQSVYIVMRQHKSAALGRILDVEAPTAAIVFCRTRTEVEELTETLNGRGYRAEPLHGGMSQEQRDRVMGRMRNGTAELLIATDVAARGLDLDQLTHVFNYDVPAAAESYVHRIGRVGRAGREGIAITLAEPREQRLLGNIERLTKQAIAVEKLPTVADLRARQLEQTLTSLTEAIAGDDLVHYEGTLEALLVDHDIRQVALAAIKISHATTSSPLDRTEIPDGFRKEFPKREGSPRDSAPREYARKDSPKKEWAPRESFGAGAGGGAGAARGERFVPSFGGKPAGKVWSKDKPNAWGGDAPSFSRTERPTRKLSPSGDGESTRLYINMGKTDGIRPQDLVGAIANETNLSGKDIGPIKIAERYSIVGIPEHAADAVIEAIKHTTLKGKRAKARRYSE